eukprot:m.64538 g.64538  ORF g.64538 m.64538 type:complete len:655 (+) comp35260_c0_seq3:197-2161(+)
MASTCPELRWGHLSAYAEGQMLVWGGATKKDETWHYFPHDIVWGFNVADNSWLKQVSTYKQSEDIPNTSVGSQIACLAGSRSVYQFGGVHQTSASRSQYFSDLHKLNRETLEWKRVFPKGPSPDGRSHCGLCVLEGQLVMVGGLGIEKRANDVWTFSIEEQSWNLLGCKGMHPSPRSGHSFTSIDEHRAFLFGGWNGVEVFNDAYLFHMGYQEWRKISSALGPDTPTPRCFHSAICENIPGEGPHLFILWGRGDAAEQLLSNAVIIEPSTVKWENCKNINVPDVLPTSNQTMCSVLQKQKLLFIRFGGLFGSTRSDSFLEKLQWDPETSTIFPKQPSKSPMPPRILNKKEKQDDIIDFSHRIEQHEFEYDEESDFITGGGYGEVYKARMKKSNQTVALKVFFRKRRNSDESELSKKEAKILLGIKPNPHIVKFIGICDSPRCYALLMEFVSGGDLMQLLTSSNPEVDKWENRLDLARQVALGMMHLHDNSPPVIHLDLKPRNVLIEEVKQVKETPFRCKICDFGLAKMANVSSVTTDRSDKSNPAGTVAYIAPERYEADCSGSREEKVEVAKKSDVFSFGVLLWEIQERKYPFEDMIKDVIRFHIKSGGKLPKGGVDAPKGYNKLVKSCSAFDPASRPDFQSVIKRLLKDDTSY